MESANQSSSSVSGFKIDILAELDFTSSLNLGLSVCQTES